jgi:hypothetical protein
LKQGLVREGKYAIGVPIATEFVPKICSGLSWWTHIRSRRIIGRPNRSAWPSAKRSSQPVGTNPKLHDQLRQQQAAACSHLDVASYPEFLKEGAAVDDFMKPDRVVVGVRRPEVADVLRELYTPILRTEQPFLAMSPESAEMAKYAATAMLATKISFINEMAPGTRTRPRAERAG